MTSITLPQLCAAEPQDIALETARAFFHRHHDNLVAAARALGGDRGVSQVFALIDDLRDARTLTRGLRNQSVALHRLLRLEYVGAPDAEETAYFMEIDILSPEVDDICRLTDAYHDMLAELAEIDSSVAAPAVAKKAENPREAA